MVFVFKWSSFPKWGGPQFGQVRLVHSTVQEHGWSEGYGYDHGFWSNPHLDLDSLEEEVGGKLRPVATTSAMLCWHKAPSRSTGCSSLLSLLVLPLPLITTCALEASIFSKASEVAGAEWEPVKFWECSAPFINEVAANLLCCEAERAHWDIIGASELQTSVVKVMAGMSQARGSWTCHILHSRERPVI